MIAFVIKKFDVRFSAILKVLLKEGDAVKMPKDHGATVWNLTARKWSMSENISHRPAEDQSGNWTHIKDKFVPKDKEENEEVGAGKVHAVKILSQACWWSLWP